MFKREEPTGYIPDPFDHRDVFADEILGEEEMAIPPSYIIEGLPYERQGSFPYCVSFACTTLLEYLYKKTGENHMFSQPHLFFHSGGTKMGSGFRANLDVLRSRGAIPYQKFPMPDVKYGRGDGWYEETKPKALGTPFEDVMLLDGYVKVKSDSSALKKAVMSYGALLVGVQAGKGDYYTGRGVRVSDTDNHAVLLVGWDSEHWIIFDSLAWVKDAAGYGTLDISYTFNSVYAVTELPKNWKKKVEKVRSKGFGHVLNHYGKPRNLEAEQRVAVQLMDEFRKFNNRSVFDAAGRFWTVLINAVVYGGYSISYRKFGVWQPGDVINDIFHYRRTGKHIFDFNEERT